MQHPNLRNRYQVIVQTDTGKMVVYRQCTNLANALRHQESLYNRGVWSYLDVMGE